MSWPQLIGAATRGSISAAAPPDGTKSWRVGCRGSWSEIVHRGGTNEIPCPRSMHAGAMWHSKLYIFGGYDGRQRSNDLHVYDFSTNVWTLLNASGVVPSQRDRHTAVVYLNMLVIFGGYDGRTRVSGKQNRIINLCITLSS